MADYRNRANRRIQGMREAIDVEMRTTLLNPNYVTERMKGDEGTAQMFGEMFRNIFGWNVTMPSTLDKKVCDELYNMYIADVQQLGVREFFEKKNPAAFQAMTAMLLESARKGYWKATSGQLTETAKVHAETTTTFGAACTDFVCNNTALQQYVEKQLPAALRQGYSRQLTQTKQAQGDSRATILEKQGGQDNRQPMTTRQPLWLLVAVVILLLAVIIWIRIKNGPRH